MNIKLLLCSVSLLAVGYAQPASPPSSAENSVNGIPQSEYVAAQAALAEAFDNPEVAKLTAEIEKLIDRRDELLFAIAAQKHPGKAKHLKAMGDNVRELKKKRGKGK